MTVLASSARIDADDVLRIQWAEPPAHRGALVLRHKDTEKAVAPDYADGALTRVDLSDISLPDGSWSVHAGDQPVATTDPGFALDDLTDYARRPRARVMHARRGKSGGLLVVIRAMDPYAEVTAVNPGPEHLVVEGFFAFGEPPAEADVVATRRKTGEEVTGEVTIDGDRWRAELPNGPFAVESERGFWDLRIGALTVATFLDDIPDKKKKVRFPAEYAERAADRVRVRAYYTENDHLAIAATVIGKGGA